MREIRITSKIYSKKTQNFNARLVKNGAVTLALNEKFLFDMKKAPLASCKKNVHSTLRVKYYVSFLMMTCNSHGRQWNWKRDKKEKVMFCQLMKKNSLQMFGCERISCLIKEIISVVIVFKSFSNEVSFTSVLFLFSYLYRLLYAFSWIFIS